MSEYHAFLERIGREIALHPLNIEDVNDLIEAYLETACSTGCSGIQPFTESSVEAILQRSQGNIRQILTLCGCALDHGVDTEATDIDKSIVTKPIEPPSQERTAGDLCFDSGSYRSAQ